MKNKPRERDTRSTRSRIEHMKSIIANLRAVGKMQRDDFAVFLGFSPAGGRKYLQDLIADNVIQIVEFEPIRPHAKEGIPIYGLNKDTALVDAFLVTLELMPKNLSQRRAMVDHSGPGPRMQKVQAEEGRHVHMLRDDVDHKPRSVKFRIPSPCPVLAAFFGFAGA